VSNSSLLEGLKVLDLTRAVAGPYCTMILGDLGASVIKVEPPGGDLGRAAGLSRVGEQGTYFVAMNRNKKSVVLDVKTPAGKETLSRLIGWADVMVENFRVGVLDRLGFDHETRRKLNPNLVMCSISGYGQTGPYIDRKCLDLVGQTISGLASLTGDPDGPPTPAGVAVSDFVTGLNACIGILAAVLGKARKGS
jgi:CoA:oxalate CoA-transferase